MNGRSVHDWLFRKPLPASEQVALDTPVFTVVDQMPEYKGGYDAMRKFISRNLYYPKSARVGRIEGSVYVSFVVSEDGHVTDIAAIKGVNPDLDQEAIRVVSIMPLWKPGRLKGKPVKVRFVLPLNFRLSSSGKISVVDLKLIAVKDKLMIIGYVKNASNVPIVNAHVRLSQGTGGTTTDQNGFFRLEVPEQSGQIVIIHGTQEKKISF